MNKSSTKTVNAGKTFTDNPNNPNMGEIIIYQTPDGITNLEVRLEEETIWLTQEQMSELFQRERSVISKHIRNIFAEGELQENVVCAKFAHTTKHGAIESKFQTSVVQIYNLDVIISVGYRVKSQRGTQFRIWANRILKDYLIKGYAVNQKVKLAQLDDLKKTVKLLS
ncbi:MAG: virulence RhuM family protein, partial [Planctomycetaceae bacterium]|nr:virulence RhuM family protein [Planctomycetaceae bacterium]